jgi:hypothetical protein
MYVDLFLALQEREELSKCHAETVRVHAMQDCAAIPAAKVAVDHAAGDVLQSLVVGRVAQKMDESSTIPLCLSSVRREYVVATEAANAAWSASSIRRKEARATSASRRTAKYASGSYPAISTLPMKTFGIVLPSVATARLSPNLSVSHDTVCPIRSRAMCARACM